MISIIDYGMGNLRSVQKALELMGNKAVITQSADEIDRAEKLILPGVGAMAPAIERLKELRLIDAIKSAIDAQKPFLGICLGYQLLFDRSDEGGDVHGLKIIPGDVKRFTQGKVPQIGWNSLNITNGSCPLFKGIDQGSFVYFCHSYYVQPDDKDTVASTTDYEIEYASSIHLNNLFGVQFHPEKSQKVGLKILENFIKL